MAVQHPSLAPPLSPRGLWELREDEYNRVEGDVPDVREEQEQWVRYLWERQQGAWLRFGAAS